MDIVADRRETDPGFALKGSMSFRDRDAFGAVLCAANRHGAHVVSLDLAELEYVDSFAIGLFLLAHEQACAAGNSLKLSGLHGHVAQVFKLANLDAVLDMERERAPARQPPPQARRHGFGVQRHQDESDGSPCLGFSGRLVFAEHQLFESVLEDLMTGAGPRIVLDLARLDFMDSAGLSMIMIAHEEAEARSLSLVLRNATGAVAQLLNLSALEFLRED